MDKTNMDEFQKLLDATEGGIGLKWMRSALGMSMQQMSKITGLNSQASYDYWERKRSLPIAALVSLLRWLEEKAITIDGERVNLEAMQRHCEFGKE